VKPLVAQDALTPLLVPVSGFSRLKDSNVPPGTIYAVFLPEGEKETFTGLVTSLEVARFPDRIFADLLPPRRPASVSAHIELAEVEHRFTREHVVALPVIEDGRLVGAVTRESLLAALLRQERVLLSRSQELQSALDRDHRRVLRLSERLKELHEVSRALLDLLAQTADVRVLMQEGVEALTGLVGARYGAVGITDEEGYLSHFLHTGISRELADRIGRLPTGQGLLGDVLREHRVLNLATLTESPRHAGFPPHHPEMDRLLATPIVYQDKVLGRVYLCDKTNGLGFDDDDELLILAFANTLAAILVNVHEQHNRNREERRSKRLLRENRRLSRHLLTALEEERLYIARELHDEMGQCATAIQAETEIIRSLSADNQPVIHRSSIAVAGLARHMYDVAHSMIRRLRPELLDGLGLSEAVGRNVQLWRMRHPLVHCQLLIDGALDDLDEQVNIAAYRIVQECLTNVARHAQATSVTVRIERRAPAAESGVMRDRIGVLVSDNGKGLANHVPGLGLIGLRERVEALKGRLCIGRGREGTIIAVIIPLQNSGKIPACQVQPSISS
jgi:signal transduction histidine kinase